MHKDFDAQATEEPAWSFECESAARLLSLLSNEKRFRMLCLLADQECSVTALSEVVGCSQVVASQHLYLLRKGQLVTSRRAGQTIYYRSSSDAAAKMIRTLRELVPQSRDRTDEFEKVDANDQSSDRARKRG